MNTDINRFCNRYLKKLKNDKDILEKEIHSFDDVRERISFHITLKSYVPSSIGQTDYSTLLFALDDEDLKYLYDKYSKKLQEEMKQNIDEVKQMYKL